MQVRPVDPRADRQLITSETFTSLLLTAVGSTTLPGLVYKSDFELSPGESVDFLFGRFTPKSGHAPAGTWYL